MRQTSQHIQSGASYFHYYIRDHQGNNRVVANYQGTIEQTTHYYPYGGILSQSTNQGVQKYKYSGKEFDRMHGLDMYNFGARQQDPETGLFTSMDPLCEKYYNISPYMYCAGNPVRYVDVDGRDWVATNQDGHRRWTWNDDITSAEAAQKAGFDGFLTAGSILDNAVISGNASENGMTSVYLGYNANDVCYTWPNSTVTPFQVGLEWLIGKGPRYRDFTDGDYFTEMLKQHEHIQETKEYLAQLNPAVGIRGDNNYSLGGVKGVGLYIKDYSTLLTGGLTGNLAVTYLGSYNLSWLVMDKTSSDITVQFTVTNSSTLRSGTRPPVLGYTNFWNNTVGTWLNNSVPSGPASKTTQKFIWTETIGF